MNVNGLWYLKWLATVIIIIKNAVFDKKIANLNVSSLSIDRWKNIVKMTNRLQVSSALILLLYMLYFPSW